MSTDTLKASLKYPHQRTTVIGQCIEKELKRYFALLEGQPPADVYRLVMRQAEAAVIRTVLDECGGNQSRAANWLGISRGTLRCKIAEQASND